MKYVFGTFETFLNRLMSDPDFRKKFRKCPKDVIEGAGLLDIQIRALLKRDGDLLEALYQLDKNGVFPYPQPKTWATGIDFNVFVRSGDFMNTMEAGESSDTGDQ
jgi:hypothetical protein